MRRGASETQGHPMNRKRVQRLMRQMGLRALYPRPRTSQPGVGHTVYPYLLRGLSIERPNQVWATDICYIPMAHGFMYLVAIMDWYARRVLAWRVSNTFDSDFCVEALRPCHTASAPLFGTWRVDSRETCFTPFSMASSMNRYRNQIDLKML